jgi:hypothetical protein
MAFPDPYPAEHWPSSARDVAGFEFDWFARDEAGQLAVFTSAGSGFIPARVFSSTVAPYNGVIAALAGRHTAPVIKVFTGDGSFADWCDLAARGLFAYDFQDLHRVRAAERHGYDLIARPSVPATTLDLPSSLVDYLPVVPAVFGAADLVPLSLLHDL